MRELGDSWEELGSAWDLTTSKEHKLTGSSFGGRQTVGGNEQSSVGSDLPLKIRAQLLQLCSKPSLLLDSGMDGTAKRVLGTKLPNLRSIASSCSQQLGFEGDVPGHTNALLPHPAPF